MAPQLLVVVAVVWQRGDSQVSRALCIVSPSLLAIPFSTTAPSSSSPASQLCCKFSPSSISTSIYIFIPLSHSVTSYLFWTVWCFRQAKLYICWMDMIPTTSLSPKWDHRIVIGATWMWQWCLGEASTKKNCFFLQKNWNPETPPPPSSNLEAPVFRSARTS